MIAPMMGGGERPAFVCELIPIYSLKHKLFFDQRLKVINLLYQNSEFDFLLMCNNLFFNE